MEKIMLRVLDIQRQHVVSRVMQETMQLTHDELKQRLFYPEQVQPLPFIPEGYEYLLQRKERREQKPKKFLQIGAHISDMEGDFTAGTTFLLTAEGHEVKNFIVSDSAKGAPPLSDAATMRIRGRELQSALSSLDITAETGSLPDGLLADHAQLVRASIIRKIQQEQPDVIFTHAYEYEDDASIPDHIDHDTVGRETVATLEYLAQIGYWGKLHREPPALYLTSREFGKKGKRKSRREISGVVSVFENPSYLIDISSVALKKFLTLWFHRTQMDGKDYAPLIPAWGRLLGSAAGVSWAEGFYPVYIPGVTNKENILLSSLPEDVFYSLEKVQRDYSRDQVAEQLLALP